MYVRGYLQGSENGRVVTIVFHVESAIEAFTNESISVVKVSRDGLVFRCLVGLPLDKGSGNAANHNEIKNQRFYLKFQKYVKL